MVFDVSAHPHRHDRLDEPTHIVIGQRRAIDEFNNPTQPQDRPIAGLQVALAGGRWPDWASLAYPALWALAACLAGLWLFRRHAGDIADEL